MADEVANRWLMECHLQSSETGSQAMQKAPIKGLFRKEKILASRRSFLPK